MEEIKRDALVGRCRRGICEEGYLLVVEVVEVVVEQKEEGRGPSKVTSSRF